MFSIWNIIYLYREAVMRSGLMDEMDTVQYNWDFNLISRWFLIGRWDSFYDIYELWQLLESRRALRSSNNVEQR